MKEHDTYTTDSAHNFVVGLNEYAKNGWEVDFKSTFFRPEISNELLHVAHLSREVPTVAEKETVQETPPMAYYTEAQMREAYADGWFAGNKNNAAPVNSTGWPLDHCKDKFMESLPKSRDYVTVPSEWSIEDARGINSEQGRKNDADRKKYRDQPAEPPSAGERPSNDLLHKAWLAAVRWSTEPGIAPGYTQWLEMLPADPLEADRKLLRTLDADNKVIFCAKTTEQADIFYEAFKRVIGYGN